MRWRSILEQSFIKITNEIVEWWLLNFGILYKAERVLQEL